jgi:uncharacterized protein
MKIHISGLPEGVKEIELTGIPSELGLEQHFVNPVAVHVTLEKNDRRVVLSAVLEAKIRYRCDRCLDEFETTLTPKMRSVYVWNEESVTDFPEEDTHHLAQDNNWIDLTDDVRDYLNLAVPLKLVCRDDCRGLCPSCGKNLNMIPSGVCDCRPKEADPRWNKLGDILESLRKN